MRHGTTLPELMVVLTVVGVFVTVAVGRTNALRDRMSVRAAATETVTISHRRLGSSHGVSLSSSRDSMAYAPNGLGHGASNLTVVLRRGSAAETLFVSRLGRVRR